MREKGNPERHLLQAVYDHKKVAAISQKEKNDHKGKMQ